MKFALILMAASLLAQSPDATPANVEAVLSAQRDRAEAINQATTMVAQAQQKASQMVQQAQQKLDAAVYKFEKESGCKIDTRTAHCTKEEVKK